MLAGLVLAAGQAWAGVYFVSTSGDDTNSGSLNLPFRTIPRAVTAAVAGDTIYVRGGTHVYNATISISKVGNSNNRFHLYAYPGERPLLDFSSMAISGSNRGINLSGTYWHIKGVDIFKAGDNGMLLSGHYNIIEFCSFVENYDTGLQLGNGASNNQMINCDSYNNADPGQGNADGFAVKLDVGTGNYLYGCRAWQNSDDGYDGYLRPADNITTVLENCWIFMNGYLKTGLPSVGNGNGFKLGGGDLSNADSLRHNVTLINCMAFDNRVKGFDQNNNRGSMTLYNTTGYRNGTNYSLNGPIRSTSTLTLVNALALGPQGPIAGFAIQQTNSWMPPFVVTNGDFVSIDTTGVRGPRKPDGSLPDLNFMRLAKGSDLIDGGTDIVLPFNGSAPDLGCFESDWVPAVSITPVVLAFGSVYENQSVVETLTVASFGGSAVRIDSVRVYGGEFAVISSVPETVAVGNNLPVAVSFSPTTVGAQSGWLVLYSDAPTSSDTVALNGTGLSTTTTVDIPFSVGWNLVSNPVARLSDSLLALFPASSFGYAYSFDPSTGYRQRYRLLNGVGYWVKFESAGVSPVFGTIIDRDTIPVNAGWNMIGSITGPVDTSAIVWSPSGIRSSVYYGYAGGYNEVPTIEPGKAYWVKANASGHIILSSTGPTAPISSPSGQVKELSSVTIADATGARQTLYLRKDSGATPLSMFELPPIAPEGVFDVRFVSNRMMEEIQSDRDERFPIDIRSAVYPLTVFWQVVDADLPYTLTAGNAPAQTIDGTGQIGITDTRVNRILIGTSAGERPSEFALSQNYPNPFNPATQIRFSVSAEAPTSLAVFNLLGQEVATLFNDIARPGRLYDVTFDASDMASGVYLYKLQSGATSRVKKLMFIK